MEEVEENDPPPIRQTGCKNLPKKPSIGCKKVLPKTRTLFVFWLAHLVPIYKVVSHPFSNHQPKKIFMQSLNRKSDFHWKNEHQQEVTKKMRQKKLHKGNSTT